MQPQEFARDKTPPKCTSILLLILKKRIRRSGPWMIELVCFVSVKSLIREGRNVSSKTGIKDVKDIMTRQHAPAY